MVSRLIIEFAMSLSIVTPWCSAYSCTGSGTHNCYQRNVPCLLPCTFFMTHETVHIHSDQLTSALGAFRASRMVSNHPYIFSSSHSVTVSCRADACPILPPVWSSCSVTVFLLARRGPAGFLCTVAFFIAYRLYFRSFCLPLTGSKCIPIHLGDSNTPIL